MGTLYVVATPIGNLSDFSPRAIETLENADLIAAEDTRRTLKLLNRFNIKTKLVSYHKFNENGMGRELIRKLTEENLNIALVSDAGTPCISDPGCILVEMARSAGAEVTAIPGASATVAALSVCGFVFEKFTFMGFVPREKKEKKLYFEQIAASPFNTFVLYESPNRIAASLDEIAELFPDSSVFVINEITKLHEKSYFGKTEEIAAALAADENASLGEYTVVLQTAGVEKPACEEKEKLSAEALLVDEIVKSGCSLKEAINSVKAKNSDLSKNDIYKASLNLKEIF